VLLGLGLPEWLTIVGLVGGLVLTFKVMARASVRYEEARVRRERSEIEAATDAGKDDE
jgi:hypothetical protein